MRVEIATGLMAELTARAAADPAREICGLLFGGAGRITGHRAAANVAPDPATTFEIDPAALFAAHRAARAGGPAIVGCYHSHPRGSTAPSARDLAGATPGQLWLILAGGDAGLYRVGRDGGFGPCAIAQT